MKTSTEITNIDVTVITKVRAHANTSGYLIVKTLFYSTFNVNSTAKL